MFRGFKNFLTRGDVVVVAVGLMVALGVSTLVQAFAADIINPLLNRAQGGNSIGLGVQLGHAGNQKTFWDWGAFISAIIYFIIFMAVLYFAIVIPYKYIQARRGVTVFGEPPPAKTCPACLSDDVPVGATKCKYCGTELEANSAG
ncbi:MAG: MscL family protein [Acidimicrobiaceae bacterium]|nr:MscL family protein [Acidimicrobiaceae bacterium]